LAVSESCGWITLKSERVHFDFPYIIEAAVVCNVVLLPACLSSYAQSNWVYTGRREKYFGLFWK